LVIHYTANTSPGADAIANRNYFENHPENKVSAHYIVDDQQVVQCLEEWEMAYHVGAKRYKPAALERLSSYPNDCTIGIEMCVNRDGDFRKTYQNTVALAADICHRHGWWVDRLWRHFDITGKDCPRFWVDDSTAILYGFNSAQGGWQRFKADVEIALVNLQQGKPGAEVEKEVDGVFKDIQGHWAQKDIEEAAKLGLVSGKGDGTFDPDGKTTRAENVVLLMRLYRLLKGGK
jgi:N-acetylmuramoyl-L-alanine amidase CwlA